MFYTFRIFCVSALILLGVSNCSKVPFLGSDSEQTETNSPTVSNEYRIETVPLTSQETDLYVEKGKYLVDIAACGVCHSKGNDFESPLSGGRILYDNYGKIVPPNITPDISTGIGSWKVGEIKSAIRESIGKDGKRFSISAHQNYRWISDEDALAISIYLQSLKPIKNDLTKVDGVDKDLNRWGFLNSHVKFQGYVPNLPEKSAGYRGLYLVSFVQGCARCHSANERMADKEDFLDGYKGQVEFLGDLKKVEIPSIRNNEKGIKNRSEDEIISHFSKKSQSDGCPTNYYSRLNDVDKKAIAVYLKSLK